MHALEAINEEIIHCRRCPRLVAWREAVAAAPPARFRGQTYWARPVPGFGDPLARLLVVGLAPAAHGGNRTGRMFTGDPSGDWLYRALHRAGFASQPVSRDRGDGLRLTDCYISAVVRCAPPDNKPLPEERDRCLPYLVAELQALERVRVIVSLGAFAWDGTLRALRALGYRPTPARPQPAFGHGAVAEIGPYRLVGSYHPSRRNTSTRLLSEAAFDDVFALARRLLANEPQRGPFGSGPPSEPSEREGALTTMQLGYGLITCQRYPGDSRTWADLYREAVEMAKLCEEAGLDSVWTSEHHFVDDGYMPSLAVTSAAIAQATGRIEVGTGVLLAPLYHPLRLAEDAATVDCIAGGRFILGVGAGWRAEEFDRLGIPQHGLGRRLSETVRILRGAWGPDPFSFEGKVFAFGRTNVTPKPHRPIPIFIGGHAAGALRRVGRLGDGYLGSSVPLEDVPQHMHLVRAGLSAAGREPAGFRCWVHEPVWVTEDPDRDLEEAIRRFAYVRWKYADMANAEGRPSDPLPEPPPLDDATRAGVARQLIYGTPQQVAEKVSAFGAALGEGAQLVARSYYPGLSFERSAAMIELLGEVKRLVRSPAGAGQPNRV